MLYLLTNNLFSLLLKILGHICIVTMCLPVCDGINFAIKLNPLTISVPRNIETSQFICNLNKFTSFYKMGTLVVNRLSLEGYLLNEIANESFTK